MNNEPLVTTAIVTTIVGAILLLLSAFGIPITAEQQDAINKFVAVLAPIVVALIARQWVTPTSNPQAKNTRGVTVPLVPVDGSQLEKKGK